MLHRGGAGIEGYEYIFGWQGLRENCSSFCSTEMLAGGLNNCGVGFPHTCGFDPYYLRCFEVPIEVLPNSRRLQYISQLDTIDLDPTLPIMNITDKAACMGIIRTTKYSTSFAIRDFKRFGKRRLCLVDFM